MLGDAAPEAGGRRLLRRGANAPADRRRSAIFTAASAVFAAAGVQAAQDSLKSAAARKNVGRFAYDGSWLARHCFVAGWHVP